MANIWKEHIDKEIGHLKKKNENISLIERSITGNVHPKMKESLAVSEIMTMANHLRAKIRLLDGTLVPVNGISFILAESGASKDRGLSSARKCFAKIYKKMEKYLEEKAVKKAQQKAVEEGREPTDWRMYYHTPKPLFAAIGTTEGLVSHLNYLEDSIIGGGYLYTGEVGSELMTNPALIENIRLISELYDIGKKEVKIIKSNESQSREIKNMNMSALFIGSHHNIIYDQTVKKKFQMEFTTKLARRTFFNFNNETLPKRNETVPELIERERKEQEQAMSAVVEMEEKLDKIQPRLRNVLEMEDGLFDLYNVVSRYFDDESEKIDPELESYKLSVKHTQWRALKFAGALCQLENREIVTKKDFAEALHYCETIESDIKQFNIELNKDNYELLNDYCKSMFTGEPLEISAHKLYKLGYIENTRSTNVKLKELVGMANIIAEDGIYEQKENFITYSKLIKKDEIGASFKLVDFRGMDTAKTKEERRVIKDRVARQVHDGFEYKEREFAGLAGLLSNDTAFNNFQFKDGKRSNENIEGGTKWLCLDIDHSNITDEECHDMLIDFNHHIARTSDKDNPFKFRVAIEMDTYVEIESRKWKKFIMSVGKYLGLTIDPVPQSQIYYGYKGRRVLSQTEGDLLEAKEHLLVANQQEERKPKVTGKQARDMLNDSFDTFDYAYEAKEGKRGITLIRAAKHAVDLGATRDQVISLMNDINAYWVTPLEDAEFERTIIGQIERWEF